MPDVGMSGGGKLDMYLRRLAEHVGPPQEVRIGFLAGATEADGTSIPMIAFLQEYGAPNVGIPPRPFFRNMIAAHKGEWGDQLRKVLVAMDYDGTGALSGMGEEIKGQLEESIVAITDPPLAPSTVARKGSAKLLVDTGTMLASIGWEVDEA